MKQFNLKIVLTVLLVFGSLAEAKYLKQKGKIASRTFSEADLDFDPVFLEAFKEKKTREMKGIQVEKAVSFLENSKKTTPSGSKSNKPGSVTPVAQNSKTPDQNKTKPSNQTFGSDQKVSIPKATMNEAAKEKQESAQPPKKTEKLEPGKSKDQNLIQDDQKRYEAAVEKKLEGYKNLTEDDKKALRENYSLRRFKANDESHKKKLIRSSLQVIIRLSKAFAEQGKDESNSAAEAVPENLVEPEAEKILTALLDNIPKLGSKNEQVTQEIEMSKLFPSDGDKLATNLKKLVNWFANSTVQTKDTQYEKINVANLGVFKTELASDKLDGMATATRGGSVSIQQGGKDVTHQLQNGHSTPANQTKQPAK